MAVAGARYSIVAATIVSSVKNVLVEAMLNQLNSKKSSSLLHLRQTRARKAYYCCICSSVILPGKLYFRDEPHPLARKHSGAEVKHLCSNCVLGANGKFVIGNPPYSYPQESRQLTLAFGEDAVIRRTLARVVDITPLLIQRILTNPSEIYEITPEQFEWIILNRIRAMGLEASCVGHTYQRDGGIDIIFWPKSNSPIPFLGAIQVKHHRSPKRRTGPKAVREMVGVLRKPFNMGIIITNTSFTPTARWAAENERGLIRLRDIYDLRRWLLDRFTDEEEWREMPTEICLGPDIVVKPSYRQKSTMILDPFAGPANFISNGHTTRFR